MKTVAVLPTGDWAQLNSNDEVCVYTMSDEDFEEFQLNSDCSLGKIIATYTPATGFLNSAP